MAADQPIVRTFLTLMYQRLVDGSHIFTVSGHDESLGRQAVFQRYGQTAQTNEEFWGLFRAVQAQLNDGGVCIVTLRSMIAMGAGRPAKVEIRTWTLTPLGIIPASGREFLEAGVDPETGGPITAQTNVFYEDAWDAELEFSSVDPEEFEF